MPHTNSRLLLLALAVGSLAIVTSANGCSGTREPTDDDDAGTTADAGTTDAGKKPDAGTKPDAGQQTGDDPHEGSVGSACDADAPFDQGDCTDGLVCSRGPSADEAADNNFFPLGACTAPCNNDSDCGTNGSVTNRCVQPSQGSPDKICLRACDPLVLDSCNRPSQVCQGGSDGKGVCIPRCDLVEGTCGTMECDLDTGKCKGKDYYEECDPQSEALCSINPERGCVAFQGTGGICINVCASSNDCPSGSLCGEIKIDDGSGNQVKFCSKKCGGALDPQCPTGTKCLLMQGSTQKQCLPTPPAGTTPAYGDCSADACVEGTNCLSVSGNAQVCIKDCSAAGATCPANQKCIANGTSGEKICLIACTGTGQSTCPAPTTCQQNFCLP